ncbi:hypothetical protein [Streptomyces sp. NPDC005302]|uniref:hypothetical protein n=1 Tax=Streptomyces sp. NPDC005302 TaxID=3154675 RepID=UPI00339DF936
MKKLTGGQIAVLILAVIPMTAVGAVGVIGTYTNAASVLHRKGTALGMVAGGEGATLVAALVMIVVTMFGQTTPRTLRAALWLLPASAAVMGVAIAPSLSEMVVFALTPLAMTASAEGVSFLARRLVVHRTAVDIETQQRNATILRKIAYHRARAERHPWKWVRKWSTLRVWRLLAHAGDGDAQLGAGLVTVQRDRLTAGAGEALGELLSGHAAHAERAPDEPASHEPEPGSDPEPDRDPGFETTVKTALDVAAPELLALPTAPPAQPVDQQGSREPVLSPAEPLTVSLAEPDPEPEPDHTDQIEQQIVTLATRLKDGEQLTKTSAAHLLGVSQATAGRRLRDARTRIGDGTGFYP